MLLHRIPARGEHSAVETIRAAPGLRALDDADVFVVEVVPVVAKHGLLLELIKIGSG